MTWTTLVNFWESIPGPIRSIVNVFVGLLLTAAVAYVSTGSFDFRDAILVPFVTAIVRALNPADTAYGVNAGGE